MGMAIGAAALVSGGIGLLDYAVSGNELSASQAKELEKYQTVGTGLMGSAPVAGMVAGSIGGPLAAAVVGGGMMAIGAGINLISKAAIGGGEEQET